MERRRGVDTRRRVAIIIFFCALAIPLFAVAGCGKQLARMEDNQIRLQAMVTANARDLATISSQLDTGQGKINESIQTLDGDTQQVAANVASVRDEQRQFRDAVAAGHEGLHRRIGDVEDNQRSLQGSVAQVADVTQRTAADLTSLAGEHAALQQTVQANQQEIAGSFRAVADGQQRIVTGIGALHEADKELAADIAARHDILYAALQDSDKQSTGHFTALTSGQGRLAVDVAHVQTQLTTMSADLAAGHSSLKEQVAAGQQTLTGQIAGLSTCQQQLQTSLETLGAKSDQTAADLADTRSSLQGTLQASREALTGRIDGLAANQQNLQTSVNTLDTKADRTVADLVDAKSSLQETLRVSQEALTGQIDGLAAHQQNLQTSVNTLDTKANRTAADLVEAKSSLQETLRVNQEALTGALDALAGKHDTLYTALQNNDKQSTEHFTALTWGQGRLAADVATVHTQLNTLTDDLAAGSSSLKEQLAAGQQTLTTQIAGLSAGQQQLQTSVESLGTKANQTATDLADTRSSLQETLRANQEALTGGIAGLSAGQQNLQTSVGTVATKVDQTATDLADTRSSLQETLRVNREVLTGQMAASLQNQQALQSDVRDLSDKADKLTTHIGDVKTNQDSVVAKLAEVATTTDRTARDVTTLNDGQAALQQSIQAGNTALAARAGEFLESQQALQNRIDNLGQATQQVASDVTKMATGQDALQQTLQAHSDRTDQQVANLAGAQKEMKTSLDTLTATAGQTDLDIMALTTQQDAIQAALQSRNETLDTRLAQLADNQQQMQSGLDTVTATTGQAALDILGVTKRQNAIQAALQSQNETLGTRMAQLADNHQQMQSSLDTVTATTGQAALDIKGVTTRQDAIQTTLQNQNETLDTRLAQLADSQQQMQGSLDTVTATTGQTGLDLLGVTTRQDAIQASLQSHKETLDTRMAQLADNQEQMQSSLDTVTATTGQTGLDLLGLTKRQDAVQATLQGQNEALGARIAQLADNQQQMQSSLDTVTATTGQAALDALALNNNQSRLGQAVQSGRQEMADKLADLAQDQQKWSERLDAAGARATMVGESVAALEQRVAKLHDLLQVSIQSTAALLDTTSQQRLQFETKVGQDLQAVIASLAQLRQTQTSLQEQITQVQRNTEGQADTLRSVIQQMKTSPNANDRARDEVPDLEDVIGAAEPKPAPAEVQVSHAAQVPPAPPVPQAAE